jgi:PTS system fructose-specific IIC component
MSKLARSLAGSCGVRADTLDGGFLSWLDASHRVVAGGVAIPHSRNDAIPGCALCIARRSRGVRIGGEDGEPVRLFAAICSPTAGRVAHLAVLSRVARILRDSEVRARFLAAEGAEEMRRILIEADEAASRHEVP